MLNVKNVCEVEKFFVVEYGFEFVKFFDANFYVLKFFNGLCLFYFISLMKMFMVIL